MSNLTKYHHKHLSVYPQNNIQANITEVKRFRNLFYLAIFGLVVFSFYLLDNRPNSLPFYNALLALAITWMGFLPSLVYLIDRDRPPIPFFPMVGIFYATNYGLPMFAANLQTPGIFRLEDVTSESLILAFFGISAMNIAFFGSKYSLWKQLSPIKLPGPFSVKKLLIFLWILLISHIAYFYIPFIRQIPSIGQFLEPIGYLTYGMFYIIWSRGKLPSLQAGIILFVCIPLEILPRLISGLLSQVMLLILFMIVIFWSEKKRIPLGLISILLVVLLVFNPVKSEYRRTAWNNSQYSSWLDKAELFINLSSDHYNDIQTQNKNFFDSVISPFVSRTSYITIFSKVIEDTPSRVPYWNGETYIPLLTSYIPRFLWPDKPVSSVGNDFGQRYGYLKKTDKLTSLNLPWIVELYVNFGSYGVLMGMTLIGIFLAFLDTKFNRKNTNFLELVFGATILFPLVYQESNFSVMVGAIFNLSLSIYFLCKWLIVDKK